MKNEDEISELFYLRRRVGELQYENKILKNEKYSSYRDGYMTGWKECTKKIRNFIIKHCENFETVNENRWDKKNDSK